MCVCVPPAFSVFVCLLWGRRVAGPDRQQHKQPGHHNAHRRELNGLFNFGAGHDQRTTVTCHRRPPPSIAVERATGSRQSTTEQVNFGQQQSGRLSGSKLFVFGRSGFLGQTEACGIPAIYYVARGRNIGSDIVAVLRRPTKSVCTLLR